MLKLMLSAVLFLSLNNSTFAQTVTIGTQVWTTKNLNVTTFRNGDPIPQAKSIDEWEAAGDNKQPAWCYLNYNPKNGTKYGVLYNWYALNDTRGLAPLGYHLPSDTEWETLISYFGNSENAGMKLKNERGWPKCTNLNELWRRELRKGGLQIPRNRHFLKFKYNSGFAGLPSGYLVYPGFNKYYEATAYWWIYTEEDENDTGHGRCISLHCSSDMVMKNSFPFEGGAAVRCIKD